jgi:hypothetical protein
MLPASDSGRSGATEDIDDMARAESAAGFLETSQEEAGLRGHIHQLAT